MASKVTKVITVSIDNDFIKMAEVVNKGKNLDVLWVETIPTPPASFDDGEIVDVEKMSRTLKQIIYKNRRYAKHISFTVNGSKIANKEVIIPAIAPSKIAALVDANASEYFPINIEEYVFTHSILERFTDEEDKSKKMRLMVIAAPETLIDSYYLLADRLELKLGTIDYAGNSAVQMIKQQIDDHPNIVIQVNENTTVVNILKSDVLLLQRTIPYGRSVVVKAVMEHNEDIEENDARKLIKRERLIHSSFDGDPITASLRYMIGNLSRIVDYYTSRNQDTPLEKAYLITNGEEIVGLTKLISSELNMPTTMISDLRNINVSKDFQMPETKMVDFIVNFGSVIAPFELKSKRYSSHKAIKEGKSNGVAILIGTIVISLVLVGWPFYEYQQALDKKESLQKQIEAVKNVEDIVAEYYDALDMKNEAEKFKDMSTGPNDTMLKMVELLEEITPKNVVFATIAVKQDTFTITGTADSKITVAKLLEEFQKTDNIYNITINGVAEERDDNNVIVETFSVSFKYSAYEEKVVEEEPEDNGVGDKKEDR